MQTPKELWFKIIYTGTEEIKNDDLRLGITKGINLFCLWIFLINLVAGPAYAIASGKPSVFVGSLLEMTFLALVVELNRRNKRTQANFFFYCILPGATFYFSVILGPWVEAQLMIVLMVGLSFFLFNRRRIWMLCIVISVVSLVLMEINFKFHLFKSNPPNENIAYLMRCTSYAVIISLVAVLFYLFKRNYDKLLNKQRLRNEVVQTSLEEETRVSLKKSNFIRTSFHEIRSEFNGMKMIIGFLNSNTKIMEIEGIPKMLTDVQNGIEKIEMVIGNFLNYSKGEAGIIEKPLYAPINLNLILKNMVDINQYFASRKNVQIAYMPSSKVPEYIVGDQFKINQIFTNLLHNAIKFSKPDTTVYIVTEREDDYWKISVVDQGVGIAQDKLNSIFNPFVSEYTRDNAEGVGLGLHIAQKLVLVLSGHIEVQSERGMGSTFSVYLPVIQTNSAQRENSGETAKEMQISSLN